MIHMIIVFPKKEVGVNIRNILNRNGLDTAGVCTTGAQALQCADTMDEGIVICGYRMKDMMYSELRECLPDTFEMLLISSTEKWSDGLDPGVLGRPMPLKVYDLHNSVEMLRQGIQRRRKKRRSPGTLTRSAAILWPLRPTISPSWALPVRSRISACFPV